MFFWAELSHEDPGLSYFFSWGLPLKGQHKAKRTVCLLSCHTPSLVYFSYFRKGPFFGLACFANMPVESELERGARMKSVGILSPSYTLLYRYMHFLENQVRYVPYVRARGGRRDLPAGAF